MPGAALALSSTGAFGLNLAVTLGAVLLMMLVTLAVALRVGRHAIVDVVWGLGFTVVALVTFALSGGEGDTGTRVLVTAMVAVWGLRLAVHIGRRNHGKGEDPRYEALLARGTGDPTWFVFRRIYLTQAVVLWFVSFPVQAAQYTGAGIGVVAAVGLVVWAIGLGFEAVGDRQLERFRADPASRGQVMDRGLWRYTRHPNYFGDATAWWGVLLVAASDPVGLLTILSPLAMTWLLVYGSGARLLESDIGERRPGYDDYKARTSGFFPLPPKRRGAAG